MSSTRARRSRTGREGGLAGDLSAFEVLPDPIVVVVDDEVVYANHHAVRLLDGNPIGQPGPSAVRLLDESGQDWWRGRPAPHDAPAGREPDRDVVLLTPTGRRQVRLAVCRFLDGEQTWQVFVLRRAERGAHPVSSLPDVVASVSHDLHEPLRSALTAGRSLLMEWEELSDTEKRHAVTSMNADNQRITRLVGELLDVTRIDSGRLKLRRERSAMGPIIGRVVARFAADLHDRPITGSAPASLPPVDVDTLKVEQVLRTFCEYVIGSSEQAIQVHARATTQGRPVMRVVVGDEAAITAEDMRAESLSGFHRRHADQRTGSGFELYIARGIIDAHGGRTWAETGPSGTRLLCELPIAGAVGEG